MELLTEVAGDKRHAARGTWQTYAPRAPLVLHPLAIFSSIWLGVIFLYSFHLSFILRYTTSEAATVVFWIWIPFVLAVGCYSAAHWIMTYGTAKRSREWKLDRPLLEHRLELWFRIWIGITIVEVGASGGVPILWALLGSSKTYVDFGIHSLHGLVNSLQTTISICYFILFLITKEKRLLKVTLFFVVWSIVIINRNMMLVTLIELAVLYIRLRKIKVRTFAQLGGAVCVLILAFGVIGDIRQGSPEMIRAVAQPTDEYPAWLPSGVLWAYIYITTPINNLTYTMDEVQPAKDILFPNTVATLFPSVIRIMIYGGQMDEAESGQLVTSAFNVSTAFIGPYQDYGFIGTTAFSILIAVLSLHFWVRVDIRSILIFAVLAQCLVLSLFFDHFLYLPVITQLGWLWYLFLPRIRGFFRFAGSVQGPEAAVSPRMTG